MGPSTVERVCDRLIYGFFISILFVTPFVYNKYMDASVAFRRPKQTAFGILCALIITTWLVKYIEAGDYSFFKKLKSLKGWRHVFSSNPYAAPATMLVIACLLSLNNAASQYYYWDTAAVVFAAMITSFILTNVIGDNYKRLLSFIIFICLTGSFMGGYCMLQYYGADPLFVPRKAEYEGRTVASGFIDNPNTVSGYLVAVMPIVLSFFFVARRPWARALAIIGPIGMLGGLLSACTRGALIAGVFAILVFLALVFLRSRYKRGEKKMIAIWAAVVGGFVIFYLAINPYIVHRIANTGDVLNLRQNTRYVEWASGKRMIADHFLIGLGLGNYKYYYLDYRGDAAREIEFIGRWEKANQAHNEYVQVASELGFLGLFSMLWLIGAFVWLAFRAVMRIKKALPHLPDDEVDVEQRRANLLNGLMGGLLGLAGHCAFMFPLHIVPSGVVGAYILALAYSLVRMPREALMPASALATQKPQTRGRGR